MKKSFPGYYRPTEEEFSELWGTCLFVPDANVLLNLYRYTPETSDEFLSILRQLADRLWIPHQVGLEYQKRRFDVIARQIDAYHQVKERLEEARKELEGKLNAFQKHPFIVPNRILESIGTVFSQIQQELEEYEGQHPDFLDDDSIRDTLTLLLHGKVGPSYPEERLNEIYREGKDRYEAKIPPGYMDSAKTSSLDK